jgi:3-dehydroquinate synthase
MQRIKATGYDIIIKNGLIGRLGANIPDALMPRRALLIADERVARLYGARAKRSLEAVGIVVHTLPLLADGYPQTLHALNEISTKMNSLSLGPDDEVVAMGGSVLCDMCGFAAWNHRQVVRLIQVPTTVMGMIDWSVRGKTAVEHKVGTRMIGSFFPPSLILIDPQTTYTQDDRSFISGMAEVIKCACATDPALFVMLEGMTGRAAVESRLEEIAWRCLVIKQSLDGREQMKMMLGHHMGHILETAQRYRGLLHGEAIGLGMLIMVRFAEAMGMSESGTTARLEKLMRRYRLPVASFADESTILAAIRKMPRFEAVIPSRIGWSSIEQLDSAFLMGAWNHFNS